MRDLVTYDGIDLFVNSVTISGGINTADEDFYNNATVKYIDTDNANNVTSNASTSNLSIFDPDVVSKANTTSDSSFNPFLRSLNARGLRQTSFSDVTPSRIDYNVNSAEKISPLPITSTKRREINLSCFLITRDSQSEKNKLINSLSKANLAQLKLKGLLPFTVKAKSWKNTEDKSNLGIANFEITFVEDSTGIEDRQIEAETIFFNKPVSIVINLIKRSNFNRGVRQVLKDLGIRLPRISAPDQVRAVYEQATDFFYSSFNTIAGIPTVLNVVKDYTFNNPVILYLHIKSLINSMILLKNGIVNIFKNGNPDLVAANKTEELKQKITTKADFIISNVDDSNITAALQDAKSTFLTDINKLASVQYRTKIKKADIPWLVLTKNLYGDIKRETQIRILNKKNLNPLFLKGEIIYDANIY